MLNVLCSRSANVKLTFMAMCDDLVGKYVLMFRDILITFDGTVYKDVNEIWLDFTDPLIIPVHNNSLVSREVCLHCLYCDIKCGLKFSSELMLKVMWYVVVRGNRVTSLSCGGGGMTIGCCN
jgi:hypothetical protein